MCWLMKQLFTIELSELNCYLIVKLKRCLVESNNGAFNHLRSHEDVPIQEQGVVVHHVGAAEISRFPALRRRGIGSS